MRRELLSWLSCPECRKDLKLQVISEENGEIKEGILECQCSKKYSIKKYIPRFVESDKYVSSFSFEWAKHSKTQLDSYNINKIMRDTSRKQFQSRIDFPLEELKDKLVLDVGCGMGRYAEVVSQYGAIVIGIDLSYSIDFAYQNLGNFENVHLIQADIFSLPFKDETFDFIYSYGVLHHTPEGEKAFKQLPRLLKKGGKLSIFVYSSYNKMIVYSSNFWRFITTRLPKRLLYYFSFISVILYYFYKIPIIGQIGKAIFVIPMWPDWRWRVLDTFDWYSPKYQSQYTHWEVFRWFKECGLSEITIHSGEVSISGTKC